MEKPKRIVPPMHLVAVGTVIASLLFSQIARAQNPVYHAKLTKQRASVVILAISSSVHIASGSQEIYLAEVSIHGSEQQFAKLIDRYSAAGYAVRSSLLQTHRILKMRLVRPERCDVEEQNFFLSDNPKMIFDTSAPFRLKEHVGTIVPCYLIVHEDTMLAKQ